MHTADDIPTVQGAIPYRLAPAGGWIDQPFVSRLNPSPPGSMVVVSVEPDCWYMERAGIATGTRNVAQRCWPDGLPDRPPAELVRELYAAENHDKAEPSGSQDMIGLIYPGISRLDYDFQHTGGVFPCHSDSDCESHIAQWLARVIHILPVAPRPAGYNPLGEKNLDPLWIVGLLRYYQRRFAGAMYSGCGVGYLFVTSDQPVLGALHATVRIA